MKLTGRQKAIEVAHAFEVEIIPIKIKGLRMPDS